MERRNFFRAVQVPAVLTALALSAGLCAGQGGKNEAKDDNGHSSSVQGSIRIRTVLESDFPSLAKIPLQEAIQLALTHMPGGLLKAETEETNGFLVHHVEVVAADKSITEFIIDAGNGAVLAKAIDHPDDEGDHDEDDHEDGEHED